MQLALKVVGVDKESKASTVKVVVDKTPDNRTTISLGENGDKYEVVSIVKSWDYVHNLNGLSSRNGDMHITFEALLNAVYLIVVGSHKKDEEWLKKMSRIRDYIKQDKFK